MMIGAEEITSYFLENSSSYSSTCLRRVIKKKKTCLQPSLIPSPFAKPSALMNVGAY